MTVNPTAIARRWADELPREFARQLALALRIGPPALLLLRTEAVLPSSAAAVRMALTLAEQGEGPYTAGLLGGRLAALDEGPEVTAVWTGPESDGGSGRLTLAVVADLIDKAQTELILVSYATAPSDNVKQALEDASKRGVSITLLLERPLDNPRFTGPADPFPRLRAKRLAWPYQARPAGASMHGKVMVVDRKTVLVGSANLTGHALERNLECGILIHDRSTANRLAHHLLNLQGVVEV